MALGNLTVLTRADAVGPVYHIRCTVVGDNAYAAGGSAGLLDKLRAALGLPGLSIIAVADQSAPGTVAALSYDFTNQKLFARVRSSGAESAVADQSGVTYVLHVTAC